MGEEQIGTGSKKVRGRAKKSLDLIAAMHSAAEAAHPITGRGIGYKLFTAGLIPSMARSEMQRVYRLLKEAREEGIIPWSWIVDETRGLEIRASWTDPDEFAREISNAYVRDFWINSLFASRYGARREPCAACLSRYSMLTAWASR